MAVWSRRQLLYKIIRRFLVQVKCHAPEKYRALKPETVQLYEQNNGWIFGVTSPMKHSCRGKTFTSEEHLGYDMRNLLEKFASDPQFNRTPTYSDIMQKAACSIIFALESLLSALENTKTRPFPRFSGYFFAFQ